MPNIPWSPRTDKVRRNRRNADVRECVILYVVEQSFGSFFHSIPSTFELMQTYTPRTCPTVIRYLSR